MKITPEDHLKDPDEDMDDVNTLPKELLQDFGIFFIQK